MPVGKKLVVVMSVLATGIGTAFFFRKDASQTEPWHEAQEQSPFRDRVERRVVADAAWNTRAIDTRQPAHVKPKQALRVPTAATVAMAEPNGGGDRQPSFQKSFNPVGALLEPLESTPTDEPIDTEPTGGDYQASLTHRIADGDTLSKLAAQYLGRMDRYLEIYEFNRDVLGSPDLLPIGVVLKIPPRDVTESAPPNPPGASNEPSSPSLGPPG